MSFTLTEQDKSLIHLATSKEAKTYDTVYGGQRIANLTTMTIAEVMRWQQNRRGNSAVGKYQMIPPVLEEETRKAGLNPLTTRFTKDTQDFLMMGRLKSKRGYEQFKSMSLGSSELANAQAFALKLAQEFASLPVPYAVRGARAQVQKGMSYYSGVAGNKSHHDPDTVVNTLIEIRKKGPGAVVRNVTVSNGTPAGSAAARPTGESARTQARNMGLGGGTRPTERANTDSPAQNIARQKNGLPPADKVYVYELIHAFDDRYDFRTGKKVTDITLLGTQSVAAYNQANSATTPTGSTAAGQVGVAPIEPLPENWTVQDIIDIVNRRDQVATSPGRYTDFFQDPYDPAALLTVPGRQPPAQIPGNATNVGTSSSGTVGSATPNQSIPQAVTQAAGAAAIANTVAGSGIGPDGNPASAASTPAQQQATDLRAIQIDLQRQYDVYRRNIATLIASATSVLNSQPAKYLITLRTQLVQANATLEQAKATGNSESIFAAESEVLRIQSKINLGSPYGLTASSKEQLAKNDPEYIGIVSQIQTNLSGAEAIYEKARSQGVDLAYPNITSNLTAIPPRVVFE